jgi:hypothetical protein
MPPEIPRKPAPAHDAIDDLVRETQRPVDEVRSVYEQQLAAREVLRRS